MHDINTNNSLNTNVAVRGILRRARRAGLKLTREEVLEELKFREDDDTSQWTAMVDRLMAQEQERHGEVAA